MKVVKYDCFDIYFFNLEPYHDLIYEKAQYYNDKSKLIPSKEIVFIELLNYYLKNHHKDSFVLDYKTGKILKDVSLDCRSPIEYFSEESLEIMMDLILSEVWTVAENMIPVTLRHYQLGYNLIHSGLMCIGVDKRELKHAYTDDVSFYDGFIRRDNELPS